LAVTRLNVRFIGSRNGSFSNPLSVDQIKIERGQVMERNGLIIPKDYYERVGKDQFRKSPIGTGPYKWHSQVVGSSNSGKPMIGIDEIK
jgi:hypothetical protein